MTSDVKNLLNRLLHAVEFEREEERLRHSDEIRKLTGREREEKGRAFIDLKKKKVGRTIGGEYLYEFRKNNGKAFGQTQITTGDQLIISQYDPMDSMNPKGMVYDMSSRSVTVAVQKQLDMAQHRAVRLDLFINDVTFGRLELALINAKSPYHTRIQTMLSGFYQANSKPVDRHFEALNSIQNSAVSFALGNNGYYSIQGPPGTGKTYTAAHLVKAIVATGQRILITADSNAAVDHLVRKLIELGEEPLRIGNPIRVNADLKGYTMDYRVAQHALFGTVQDVVATIQTTKEEQATYPKPGGPAVKGYTFVELWEMIERGKSTKSLPKTVLKSLKPWIKTQMKLDALYEKLKELRKEIQQDLISTHQIIAATNSTAGGELLELERFDWAIVDEAAQASIPSTLIPILKAQRFVLVGDHFQLPPVVLNQEAKDLGLAQSLMDFLARMYPYQLMRLNRQYRMHQVINDLVSAMFYDGELIADETVKDKRLPFESKDTPVIKIIQVDGHEKLFGESKSYYNEEEIEKVLEVIAHYTSLGLSESQIAVITPYKAQARMLSARLGQGIEMDTVDAFQGREKDLIILSFVRSNLDGNIGFLKDFRRLNVSISRAKHKIIMIGNIKTLKREGLYRELMDTIELVTTS